MLKKITVILKLFQLYRYLLKLITRFNNEAIPVNSCLYTDGSKVLVNYIWQLRTEGFDDTQS